MGMKKLRAARPDANSWDKLSAREAGDTIAGRDVFQNQQLDRGKIKRKRSKKGMFILAVVLGVLSTIAIWVLYSLIVMLVAGAGSLGLGETSSSDGTSAEYVMAVQDTNAKNETYTCYKQVNEKGYAHGDCYDKASQVPVPDWYHGKKVDEKPAADADSKATKAAEPTMTLGEALGQVTAMKLMLSLGGGLVIMATLGTWASKNIDAENLMHDTSDINQYENDQHIALPEELMRKFDYFPDAGGHSSVQVSSMISHTALSQKGLKKVDVSRRAEKDTYDSEGNLLYYAGEVMDDDEGNPIMDTKPLIDEAYGKELFEASGVKHKAMQRRFDTTKIPYNPKGENRDKLGATKDGSTVYKTVADLINDDWEFPEYEVQRPAGAYIVDTAPVNTMVLAITRAGKGQTYIEPVLDMWSREKRPSNMVVNDPKGELLVKNYIPFVTRGFEPVQFNLINSTKTDIYNPLHMASDAAREGDTTKAAQYVENIADVFFPADGGEDPVWPKAASNAFKRAVFGLIDFYMEEERSLRVQAAAVKMDAETLENKLDVMWGHVTLYNCYQLFVQLSSKKLKNPEAELEKRDKAGEFANDEQGLEIEAEKAKAQAFLWEGQPEMDMLTLFFNATAALPVNGSRTRVANADRALRAMAGAEKMLASVYGIAITAMSFFTDPTVSTLTSGRPSQNVDLGGLSFPRRLGVRFAPDYLRRDNLIGLQAVWSGYSDAMFTQSLGSDFEHEDTVSREGWARYYFKGKFPEDRGWIKLELRNAQSKMLVRTFYFEFKKNYQTSLSGRHYVVEPVTGEKLIKNGVVRELRPVRAGGTSDGEITAFEVADSTFPQQRLDLTRNGEPAKIDTQARAITQTTVRYSEKPKAVFLVTPPHLMSYARLILILIKQLVDLNFEQSYMTKSNQKPLYKTRFMLDELGNLQSDGHGISGFETMLSIGLGQEQQFTLILQTLQQLKAVYGDDVDKIVQGNVSNIIYLKSTDDAMIETLEKMSGTTHKSYIDSKQVSRNVKKLAMKNEGNVSFTMSTKEEPLIKYNDMAFIAPSNSIVFRAGDAPVWNRNETVLPMSFRLFGNKIVHPGHEYSLQTIPTLSSAMDFDVRMNQPDFSWMLDRRMKQAIHAERAKAIYQESYGYDEAKIATLDPDVYSDEVMEIVQMLVNVHEDRDPHAMTEMDAEDLANSMIFDEDQAVENTDVTHEVASRGAVKEERQQKIYAEGLVNKEALVSDSGVATHSLDKQIAEAYKSCLSQMSQDHRHFSVGADDELRSADGSTLYISSVRSAAFNDEARKLNEGAKDASSSVYAEEEITSDSLHALATMNVHDAFYTFLASLPTWEMLADGAFDRAMAQELAAS